MRSSASSKPSKFLVEVNQYLDAASIHGLRYLRLGGGRQAGRWRYPRVIIWLVALIASVCTSIVIITLNLQAWSHQPSVVTDVGVDDVTAGDLRWPTITLCPSALSFSGMLYGMRATVNMTILDQVNDKVGRCVHETTVSKRREHTITEETKQELTKCLISQNEKYPKSCELIRFLQAMEITRRQRLFHDGVFPTKISQEYVLKVSREMSKPSFEDFVEYAIDLAGTNMTYEGIDLEYPGKLDNLINLYSNFFDYNQVTEDGKLKAVPLNTVDNLEHIWSLTPSEGLDSAMLGKKMAEFMYRFLGRSGGGMTCADVWKFNLLELHLWDVAETIGNKDELKAVGMDATGGVDAFAPGGGLVTGHEGRNSLTAHSWLAAVVDGCSSVIRRTGAGFEEICEMEQEDDEEYMMGMCRRCWQKRDSFNLKLK